MRQHIDAKATCFKNELHMSTCISYVSIYRRNFVVCVDLRGYVCRHIVTDATSFNIELHVSTYTSYVSTHIPVFHVETDF